MGIKALGTNMLLNLAQPGVPSNQKETPLSSLHPSDYVFLLTRKPHATSLVPFTLFLPSTAQVGAGEGGRRCRRPAGSGVLCCWGELRGGVSGAGLSRPSFHPSFLRFFPKVYCKGATLAGRSRDPDRSCLLRARPPT